MIKLSYAYCNPIQYINPLYRKAIRNTIIG